MTFAEASAMLCLDHTTIRKRQAGTDSFTHVRMGRRVLLVRSEVERLLTEQIEKARALQRAGLDFVWDLGHKPRAKTKREG